MGGGARLTSSSPGWGSGGGRHLGSSFRRFPGVEIGEGGVGGGEGGLAGGAGGGGGGEGGGGGGTSGGAGGGGGALAT